MRYNKEIIYKLIKTFSHIFWVDCSTYSSSVQVLSILDTIGTVLTDLLSSTASDDIKTFVTSLQTFITELTSYYSQQVSTLSSSGCTTVTTTAGQVLQECAYGRNTSFSSKYNLLYPW